jgi:hypothetical protein
VTAATKSLDGWMDLTGGLPNYDETDFLLLVLEQWLSPGKGVGSRINYDPLKTQSGGQERPPQMAFFHELCHAYYNATGTQLGREDGSREENGGRLFELMAAGLPPFQNRQFGENQMRSSWPCALRTQYP